MRGAKKQRVEGGVKQERASFLCTVPTVGNGEV